jgi:hypothetical protein
MLTAETENGLRRARMACTQSRPGIARYVAEGSGIMVLRGEEKVLMKNGDQACHLVYRERNFDGWCKKLCNVHHAYQKGSTIPPSFDKY